jgi:hypothetical protein
MKKIHILGVALVAIFAFGAVATSAFALESTWLSDGEKVAAATEAKITGELALTDLKVPVFGATTVLCSGILDGTIGPGKVDLITDILNLSGTLEEALSVLNSLEVAETNSMLNCVADKGACTEGSLAWVTPYGLPWDTEISLSGTVYLDLLLSEKGVPGYEVECENALVGKVTDRCQGNTSAVLVNEAGGLLSEFNETQSEKGNCSQGGTGEGDLVGDGFITLNNALTLTVSEG